MWRQSVPHCHPPNVRTPCGDEHGIIEHDLLSLVYFASMVNFIFSFDTRVWRHPTTTSFVFAPFVALVSFLFIRDTYIHRKYVDVRPTVSAYGQMSDLAFGAS